MKEKLCLVIPCYNEEKRMPLDEIRGFIKRSMEVGLLFVNDGSTDATAKVLEDLRHEFPASVQVFQLECNRGKAEAVRQGILKAVQEKGAEYVGYFDADLATPLDEALRLMEKARRAGASMAFGSRVKRLGIRLDRSGLRHYVGRIFATEASLLLGLPVYDTQCGAKIFKAELARNIFQTPFLSRWFFDVEIFFRMLQIYGHKKVEREAIEVPLDCWVEKGATKIKWMDFLKAPFELLRISWAYRKQVAPRR